MAEFPHYLYVDSILKSLQNNKILNENQDLVVFLPKEVPIIIELEDISFIGPTFMDYC
jgi:hypothetical protein